GGTECSTIPDHEPAANDDQVFMTYVAASVNHFARRTHEPIRTPCRAVTCSARRIAISTRETVGSSSQAASQVSDQAGAPAAAKCWTLVIVNASPRVIPVQHNRSTWTRTRSMSWPAGGRPEAATLFSSRFIDDHPERPR